MRPSRFVNYRTVLVLVLAATLTGPTSARAGFHLVTASSLSDLAAALQANDSASWSGFNVNNPTVISTNGTNVQAQGSGTQGNIFGPTTLSGYPGLVDAGGEIEGEFGSYTNSSITLTFSQPVTAAGGLMEVLAYVTGYEDSWPGQLTAYDSNGNAQSFSLRGSEFVGIVSDAGNLTRLTISTYAYVYSTQVEVGPLVLQDSPPLSSVPAPSGLALVSLGALGLLGCCCWRRSRLAIA